MRTRHAIVDPLEQRCLFAVVVPSGFTDELYDNGLSGPTAMEFAPDGRLFVTEQGGNVRVIDAGGNLLTNSFVSLNVDSAGERGILGIAFDPAFNANGFVYLYYTVPNGADGSSGAFNRVSRFTAADADANPANGYQPGNIAAAGSESILLNLNPLTGATNHNGGALHFGPDGKLYLAVGENATTSNSQTLNNHHGKILRLNVDGTAPADNPFNDADATPNEPRDYIWALGLRNPFTTAFDPVTGRFHINDVGGGAWEEVNLGQVGANYGWPTREGPENIDDGFTPPIFAYPHSGGGFNDTGDVISGGTFYRPAAHTFPSDYAGDYFFAEAGHGWIRRYDVATNTATLFATGASFPVDLKTGNDGALYYLERGSGSVRRIRFTTPPPQVTNVWVSSSAWDVTFRQHLQDIGAGDLTFGYAIPPSDQLNELPWTNLNRVRVQFSRNVNVTSGSLAVTGVNVASYGINAFQYEPSSRTAVWVLASDIGPDKLALTLTGVTDAVTGAALDGEWTNPTPPAVGGADTFSSGNGDPGGTFRFRLNVLPGDVNRSGGAVLGSDVTLVRNAQNSTPGAPGSLYDIYKDVNGSGSILGSDVTLVRNRQGLSLPADEPALVVGSSSLSSSPAIVSQVNMRSVPLGRSKDEDLFAWLGVTRP